MVHLVLVRHAKSDWSTPLTDHDRPLAARGRRQAPAIGTWLRTGLATPLDLAVVSTAARARQTWEAIAAELTAPVQVRLEQAVYTFDGESLRTVIRGLPASAGTVAVVGHNPAIEEVVARLTGRDEPMPTSCLALIELESWAAERGDLVSLGRPADGELTTF